MKKITFLLAFFVCVVAAKSQEFCESFKKIQVYDSITKKFTKEVDGEVFGLFNLESRVMRIGGLNGMKEAYSIQSINLPKDTLIIYCLSVENKKKVTFKIYKQSDKVRVMERHLSAKNKTKYISGVMAFTGPVPTTNGK